MPAKIDHIDVAHEGKRYRVTMRARMDVDAGRAYAVFTDFPRLVDINPAIIKAEPIDGAAPGLQRVHTQVRVCVMSVCRVFDQVQDMQLKPPEQLSAQVIPELSNLRFGQAQWRIWDQEGEAHLHFFAEIEPDFWIPPIVGPWLIKRKLQSEAEETANGIEQLALALAPPQQPKVIETTLAGAL
nr:SRPBCC family protein [Oceanococcus sp. HetDA_MAG_MS8]